MSLDQIIIGVCCYQDCREILSEEHKPIPYEWWEADREILGIKIEYSHGLCENDYWMEHNYHKMVFKLTPYINLTK